MASRSKAASVGTEKCQALFSDRKSSMEKEPVTLQDRSGLCFRNMMTQTKKGLEVDPRGDKAKDTENLDSTDNEGLQG